MKFAPPPLRTSEILLEFANAGLIERVRLADLDELLGERSFGCLLLLFALPNAFPHGLPGVSTVTGIPLGLIAFQMLIGMQKAYLPRWLSERSLNARDFRRLMERTAPLLRKVERVMKPRWLAFSSPTGQRWVGACCLTLALVLALPIPFGNLLPAIAVVLIALGLIERDGIVVSGGIVLGIFALAAVWGVLWAMMQAAGTFLRHFVEDAPQ